MKKVINGKVYNTETADLIASGGNDLSRNDFGWCEESLYKTKNGAWFLQGKGGARSRWAESVQNGSIGGSGMEALTTAEALEWCENHDVDADLIAEHFDVKEA